MRGTGGDRSDDVLRLVCWNIARRHAAWRCLPDSGMDLALLQEAGAPLEDVAERVDVDPEPFRDGESRAISRTAIVSLSDKVRVDWLIPTPITEATAGDFVVSQPGCISAAVISAPDIAPVTVVSICAAYEKPHSSTGRMSWDITAASLHRVISDLSLMVGRQSGHRVIAAGDLTVLYGYGENDYWKRRYDTVFDRMAAIGLPLVGPRYPSGRRAVPWPSELPKNSLNVPTYHHPQQTPTTATRQLDFVFASESLADSISVRALNSPEEWGPSDHCRLEITIG